MPRPSSFHVAVINYIHNKNDAFSLKDVRDACGIKDPKTIRVIMHRLEAMGYVAYIPTNSINKRWSITTKWPMTPIPQTVLDDYVTAQILRRTV